MSYSKTLLTPLHQENVFTVVLLCEMALQVLSQKVDL